jgi:hypothetical protein
MLESASLYLFLVVLPMLLGIIMLEFWKAVKAPVGLPVEGSMAWVLLF